MKIRYLYLLLASLAAFMVIAGCKKTPKNIANVPAMRATPYPGAEINGIVSGDVFYDSEFQSTPFQKQKGNGRVASISPLAHYVGEELWIIHRPAREPNITQDDHYPGTGSLMTRVDGRELPLPLRHTDVKANVTAYIASVDVTQQFENPYSEKIEAVYVFPLPENGAVNEFVMQVGQRRIRGIVREREEAERIYAQAKH